MAENKLETGDTITIAGFYPKQRPWWKFWALRVDTTKLTVFTVTAEIKPKRLGGD